MNISLLEFASTTQMTVILQLLYNSLLTSILGNYRVEVFWKMDGHLCPYRPVDGSPFIVKVVASSNPTDCTGNSKLGE